jgi:imidazolonepropionase-like amidohydrolase
MMKNWITYVKDIYGIVKDKFLFVFLKKAMYFALLLGFHLSVSREIKNFVLIHGIAHIGNGKKIENSIIMVRDGYITFVGDATTIRLKKEEWDTVYNISGKHVYPALINLNNVLGLHDAEAVRATRDYHETGNLNPHVRSLIAYNTDNQIVPTIRSNGVLYTQVTPRGGRISGQSSVVGLYAWNWEDAVLKADDGIHLNFPNSYSIYWGFDEGLVTETNKNYNEELKELKTFFQDAKAYYKEKNPQEKNLRLEAMKGIWDGSKNLYVHVNNAKDILEALHFVQEFGIPSPVFVGVAEIYEVLPVYKKYRYPVILNRTHRLPLQDDSPLHIYYKLPSLLKKDSIPFAISMSGDMEAMNSRNLSYNAGTAVAWGLSPEDALESITLSPARILKLDHLLGTIEEKKIASLIVTEGDILDMATSQVSMVFYHGKRMIHTNKQNELYEKYLRKYQSEK